LWRSYECKAFFPGIDSEIELLSIGLEAFRNTKCLISISNSELVVAASDKVLTARYLEKLGLPFPKTSGADKVDWCNLRYPVISKPRKGYGSKGVEVVQSEARLKELHRETAAEELCIQEYIEGVEYTCSLIFDTKNSLRDSFISSRELENGRTVSFSVLKHREIQKLINEFGSRASGAFGSINLQLRVRDGVPYVFEINPRFSGSTAMRVAVGYNEPARLIEHLVEGTPIMRQEPLSATVFRVWSEVVVSDSEGNR